MSARLRLSDFIFMIMIMIMIMSHDQLAVPSGGLVLWLCTCIQEIKEIWESGVLGTGKRCEDEDET